MLLALLLALAQLVPLLHHHDDHRLGCSAHHEQADGAHDHDGCTGHEHPEAPVPDAPDHEDDHDCMVCLMRTASLVSFEPPPILPSPEEVAEIVLDQGLAPVAIVQRERPSARAPPLA
ncbi:MAG: hypothetical protein H6807_11525 [Planctomycetes bacterium]|nr:hypothetical protein [Planctomycetota bacterium]